jgi:AcrR family transcriptional regulator
MQDGITRKDSITQSAMEIINEIGIEGFSIRELAKRQGITEAAIYRHYESKQEILLSIIAIFRSFVTDEIQRIERENLTPVEGIQHFIKSHTTLFEKNHSIASIVLSEEIFRNDSIVTTQMREIFYLRTDYITRLIEKAQKRGKLSRFFSAQELTDVILGLLRRLTTRWRMSGYDFPLEESVLKILEKVLTGPAAV